MRNAPFMVPFAAASLLAGGALAQSPDVTVTVGPRLQAQVDELGERDVTAQAEALAVAVREALARENAMQGAQVRLVLADLKPNRPTRQQTIDRPGLDPFLSVSIGGASIEGEVILADGTRRPIDYDRYTSSLADVHTFEVWYDARRAFRGFARQLADGRL